MRGATERFDGDDRHALRATLARATRWRSGTDLIVADGLPVGRVLPWGSVALYRPDPAAPLRHRVLELDPQGRDHGRAQSCARGRAPRSVGEPRRRQRGRPDPRRGASSPLGSVGPPRSRGAGPRARAAHRGGGGRLERRRSHSSRRRAGPAARRRGRRAAERPRGAGAGPGTARAPVSRPVSDRAALLEPHRVVSLRRGRRRPRAVRGGRRGRRSRGARPRRRRSTGCLRPTSGGSTRMGSSSSSGTASSAWSGRAARYHRPSARASVGASTASCAWWRAGGRRATSRRSRRSEAVIEDHLTLDERAEVLERHSPGLDPPGVEPVAGPWREASGRCCLSKRRHFSRGPSRRSGRESPRVGTGPGRSRRRERGDATPVPEARARVSVEAPDPRRWTSGGRWRRSWCARSSD